jgi:hypothetical protein
MTNHGPTKRAQPGGQHWLFTAVAMPPSPLLSGVTVQQNQAWHACVARHAPLAAPTHGPCAAPYFLRFDPGLSPEAGRCATRDPGISPDRTHTGWLP